MNVTNLLLGWRWTIKNFDRSHPDHAVYPDRTGLGMHVTAALRFIDTVLPWMAEDGLADDLAVLALRLAPGESG